MSKTVVRHIRFNLDKESHRRALELLQSMDGNRYPTFADAVAEALIAWFNNIPARAGLNADAVQTLVEPYVVKLSEEVLRVITEKLPTLDVQTKDVRSHKTSSESPDGKEKADGQYADAIPLDEIPWDFLKQ